MRLGQGWRDIMLKNNDSKLTYTTGVSDFKRKLTYYLSLVEQGSIIIITRYGKVAARVIPNSGTK